MRVLVVVGLVLQLFVLRDVRSEDIRTENVIKETVTLGGTVTVTIRNGFSDAVTGCFLRTVEGDLIQFRTQNLNSNEDFVLQPIGMLSSCSVAIRNVKTEYLGDWALISHIRDASHNEFQVVQPFQIIDRDAPPQDSAQESVEIETQSEEDDSISELPDATTAVPQLEEPSLEIESSEAIETEALTNILEKILYVTSMGRMVETRIPNSLVRTVESCHLKTPEGLVLDLHAGLEYPGLQVLEGNLMSFCIIQLTVSEDMNGEWELYSRETNGHETYQPFTISIEEPISTFPKDLLTIETGQDMYLRLDQDIEDLVSCDLVPSTSEATRVFQRDARYQASCGFLVHSVGGSDNGKWTILAQGRIAYKAEVDVSVEEHSHPTTLEPVTVTSGEPLHMQLGPDNALFCQLSDPAGSVVFSGFRACRLELGAAASQHAGLWSARVALPGRLSALQQTFELRVEEAAENLNRISAAVQRGPDDASLSCSLLTDRDVGGCKFLRPDDAIFIANEGVGEGRYSYFGNGVSTMEAGHTLVDCGLHISSLEAVDLGAWRCLVEAGEEVFSSFLRVSSDLAAEAEEAVAVVAESAAVALAGEPLTLSCGAAAHLQYCWFRAPNGTDFPVAPGVSHPDYEYHGAGLGAGECGMRLRAASVRDTGAWSCGVGIAGARDLSVLIDVTVHASPMVVSHTFYRLGHNILVLRVEGRIYNASALDYCRFVNPKGIGFPTTAEDLPAHYNTSGTNLTAGFCRVTVTGPWWDEHGVWTVAGALAGGLEVSGHTQPQHMWQRQGGSFFSSFWIVLLIVCLNVALISVLVNKRSRRWTAQRATAVSSTIRNSFRKPRTQATATGERDAPPTYDTAVSSADVNQDSNDVDQGPININQGPIDVTPNSNNGNQQSRANQNTNTTLIEIDVMTRSIDTPVTNNRL